MYREVNIEQSVRIFANIYLIEKSMSALKSTSTDTKKYCTGNLCRKKGVKPVRIGHVCIIFWLHPLPFPSAGTQEGKEGAVVDGGVGGGRGLWPTKTTEKQDMFQFCSLW